MAHTTGPVRRAQEQRLSMKIYSAFLGGAMPRIRSERVAPDPENTPFHAPTIGRQLRRAGDHASKALDEARERLARATKKANSAPAKPSAITLVGKVTVRRVQRSNVAA